MKSVLKFLRLCPVLAILFLLFVLLPPKELSRLSGKERDNYLRRAQVWHKTNIPLTNVFLGPKNEISVPPEKEVSCYYVEEKGKGAGSAPKFKCRLLDSATMVRVKFSNRETLGEVAGTRLLWALGFYTDETYPVKIRCFECPQYDPSRPGKQETRMERKITDAIMERNFDGEEIGEFPDQGWKWEELDKVDPKAGGASRAQLDALKLLMVFIQHTDSKASQQRLGCYDPDLGWARSQRICNKPVLMVQDLGETFGMGAQTFGSYSAMYFKGWSRLSIWNTEKEEEYARDHSGKNVCFGRLTFGDKEGLQDPKISEEGREFLAGLLNQLSDRQIRDLFRVSRAAQTHELIEENGKQVPVTMDHWLAAFKKKRDEINERRCN